MAWGQATQRINAMTLITGVDPEGSAQFYPDTLAGYLNARTHTSKAKGRKQTSREAETAFKRPCSPFLPLPPIHLPLDRWKPSKESVASFLEREVKMPPALTRLLDPRDRKGGEGSQPRVAWWHPLLHAKGRDEGLQLLPPMRTPDSALTSYLKINSL
jgi:hypothetical protein